MPKELSQEKLGVNAVTLAPQRTSQRGEASRPHVLGVVGPAPRAVWEALYQTDPEALPSQSPRWLEGICALGAYEDASRLYELSNGQELLMPAVKRKGLPGPLSVQASLPHAWGMGGVLAARPLEAGDVRAVLDDLAKRPFLSFTLVPNPRQGALWRSAIPAGVTSIPRRAHVIDLEGGFEKVWGERFASKTRNKVRKAEKLGVVVESDTTGKLVPVFYELFRRSVDRWAEQQNEPRWLAHKRASWRDPLHKLEHIASHMGEACRIWVAWHQGQAVAASLVLQMNNADYMMGAMDKPLAAPVNANDLIQKHAIEAACRAGCRYYHMGESGASAGISEFKERLGGHAYPYDEYRLERLPMSRLDMGLRGAVKRTLGFKDA